MKNLLNIYSIFSSEDIDTIVKRYEGLGYGKLKEDLAEIVINGLDPIQKKYRELMDNKNYLEKVYRDGAEKAEYHARRTLSKVYKKVGFIPR